MPVSDPLEPFHPAVRAWFRSAFGQPSPPQVLGWPSIAAGRNTLILAPTGSGKTLAAFLWAVNHLVERRLAEDLPPGVRILYVSPLKALNNDIHRNLDEPLAGILREATAMGLSLPRITAAVRTGDTPRNARAAMLRNPPDILITTPESLYLMLSSPRARGMLRHVQHVIVDEIHALCGNKRGVHLSLSLERLAALAETAFVRIGLSATQRPLERVARFLGGQSVNGDLVTPREVQIVDAGRRKEMDLRVECVAPDFALLPPDGVWPLVHERLAEEIARHRTTLVFVNNRRMAERVATRLNQLMTGGDAVPAGPLPPTPAGTGMHHVPVTTAAAADLPVQAYHGSMSRDARERMEGELKAGRIRALVATSSLELGIDIGSIDLVVQLQSPKGVARGLQRVGRSGHVVSAASTGRILPTHREDLVESAVVAEAMARHEVEETRVPENCLDVLAQQIVAAVGVETWDVDGLYDLVRASFCYRDLPRSAYGGVLAMLAGRFAGEAFRELRGRISWDRVNNRLSPLPGSTRLAVTGGGTIADRGYFGVYLPDGTTKVGEVDEEFVFESRAGDTFILGSSVWKITEIGRDRLVVAAAPGQPARMPFWRGEGIGRSFELGSAIGAFRRMLAARLDDPATLAWLQGSYPVDANAAWNILEYFRRQRDVTRIIPHDRLLVVEAFRDEIGDPRIVLHSPFGRRVNGLLGMLLAERVRTRTGVEAQMLYNDDGVLLRTVDRDTLPVDLLEGIDVDAAADSVLGEVLGSPLFAGQFRANASRALLLPRSDPRKRMPLWLQRLRAADLLEVVRAHDDFPIVIETMREVLNDVLDFPRFRLLLRGIAEGTVGVHTIRTEVPSPFAAGLLFDFIAVYMYEWDQPRADRQSGYLTLNRELLAEVADLDTMEGLVRPEAIRAVEDRLQHRAEGTRARSPEELLEVLLRLGDLTEGEIAERSAGGGLALLAPLAADGRAVQMTIAGETRWIAGEERTLYECRMRDRESAHLLDRYLATRGPASAEEIARRLGIPRDSIDTLLAAREGASLVRGRFRPDAPPGTEWCSRPTLSRIHRETLTILRKEISPVPMDLFTRFLLRWQHRAEETRFSGAAGVKEVLRQLQGASFPFDVWERDVFGGRLSGGGGDALAGATRDGTAVWTGAGQGKVRVFLRGEGNVFLEEPSPEIRAGLGGPAVKVLEHLHRHGASFFGDLRRGTGLSLDGLNRALAALFWGGFVTGDVFEELKAMRRYGRTGPDVPSEPVALVAPWRNPGTARLMQRARRALRDVPGWTGRWSPVHTTAVLGEPLAPDDRTRLLALQVLDRYGVLARELYRREGLLPWAAVAAELQMMELRGEVRRGYFVEGLSGMQYALPEAVEELRRARSSPAAGKIELVNAADPCLPYGPDVAFPPPAQVEPARSPSAWVALRDGAPVLFFERDGERIWTLSSPGPAEVREALRQFTALLRLPEDLRPGRELVVELVDGVRAAQSPLEPALRSLGFRRERNQSLRFDGYP